VGNLEAGGTGKTPVVMELAQAFLDAGRRPAILTRGYGGDGRRGVLRNGVWEKGKWATAGESGDEPLLMSRYLPSVPVVVDARRTRGALALLHSGVGVDVFLLDDGFQHRRLARDRNVVLIDAQHPFGNGRLLPAGPLREPPGSLKRADHVLLTGCDSVPPAETLEVLERYAPDTPVTGVRTTLDRLSPLGETSLPESLVDAKVLAVAAIARPERFLRLLEGQGARVGGMVAFPDHHPFTAEDVAKVEQQARMSGAMLLTSAKDAVRLEGLTSPGAGWIVVEVRTDIDGGWAAFLRSQLPGLISG
jgi:tetraacyldisaccharide 4'-kinase